MIFWVVRQNLARQAEVLGGLVAHIATGPHREQLGLAGRVAEEIEHAPQAPRLVLLLLDR